MRKKSYASASDGTAAIKEALKNQTAYRGRIKNEDTGFEITVSQKVYNDTLTYANRELSRNKDLDLYATRLSLLDSLPEICRTSVLLDTETADTNTPDRVFVHKFYASVLTNGIKSIAKLTVDEFNSQSGDIRRAYNLKNIEISPATVSQAYKPAGIAGDGGDVISAISISDLHALVKRYDKDFHPKAVNPVLLNEDGTPKAVYRALGGANADIRYSTTATDALRQTEEAESDTQITAADAEAIRAVGRKSINDFTREEFRKTEKWARKFYGELGEKSPFFRAWFGDWRAYDVSAASVVTASDTRNKTSGKAKNSDTGMTVSWSSALKAETKNHAVKDRIAVSAANDIASVVQNAIYFYTESSIPTSKSKMPGTAFMHNFYTLYRSGNSTYLLKMYVEEAVSMKDNAVFDRAYQLKDIEKVASVAGGVLSETGGLTEATNATAISISDLYELVKRYDKDFHPKSVNPVLLNTDGTPKAVYRALGGTNADIRYSTTATDTLWQTEEAENDTQITTADVEASAQAKITAEYKKEVDHILSEGYTGSKSIIMGYTPKIYQELGMPSLPFVIGSGHVYSVAKSKSEAMQEGHYNKNANYHGLGETTVKDLLNYAANPLMIISAKDSNQKAAPRRSTHSVVSIVDVGSDGNHLLLPIEITATRTVNGQRMDVNVLSSAYKKNVLSLVREAVAQENIGDVGIYYMKKEAYKVIGAGEAIPRTASNVASNNIIHRFDEKVNMQIQDVTQSIQFKRWFGDWQNAPKKASKVVNADGTPKVVYHRTNADFTIFDIGRSGENQGKTHGDGVYLSEFEDAYSYAGDKVLQLYAAIKHPFEMELSKAQANHIYETYFKPYHEDKFNAYRPHVIQALTSSTKVFDYLNEAAEKNHVKTSYILSQLGYDGVHDGIEWVAFSPSQIKSATDNVGTFDGANADIRYSTTANRRGTAGDGGRAGTAYSHGGKNRKP